jgi:hypothetical protein
LKIILELELWANRNQEFIQPRRSKEDSNYLVANFNKYHFSLMFYLNHMENGKDNSSSEAHPRLVFKVQEPVEVLF